MSEHICSTWVKRMPVWGTVTQAFAYAGDKLVPVSTDYSNLKAKEPWNMVCATCGKRVRNPDFVKEPREQLVGDAESETKPEEFE